MIYKMGVQAAFPNQESLSSCSCCPAVAPASAAEVPQPQQQRVLLQHRQPHPQPPKLEGILTQQFTPHILLSLLVHQGYVRLSVPPGTAGEDGAPRPDEEENPPVLQ